MENHHLKTLLDPVGWPEISSNFKLKSKIEKKNQIHKRIQTNKNKRMRTKFKNIKNKIMVPKMKLKTN
jgi:hypothetical protein